VIASVRGSWALRDAQKTPWYTWFMKTMNALATADALSDHDLLARLDHLAGHERETTAEIVAHLAALDERRSLYAARGYSSLFAYCREALHLSEDETCNRIEVARAARKFPEILERLASGELNLTAVRLLANHLTPRNCEDVLARAADKLRRLQDLLRREIPSGDPATIVDRALTLLLEKVEKAKHGAAAKPRPAPSTRSGTDEPATRPSRHVPRDVVRTIYRRDGEQCAFVSKEATGARNVCSSRSTTSSPTPRAGRPRWRTCLSAAGGTTSTRRSGSSDRAHLRTAGTRRTAHEMRTILATLAAAHLGAKSQEPLFVVPPTTSGAISPLIWGPGIRLPTTWRYMKGSAAKFWTLPGQVRTWVTGTTT
jgi:hypothetical protein